MQRRISIIPNNQKIQEQEVGTLFRSCRNYNAGQCKNYCTCRRYDKGKNQFCLFKTKTVLSYLLGIVSEKESPIALAE